MTASRREDYLLRQAKAIAAMLAAIAGRRLSGDADEARAELEQAYSLLLGSQGDLLRQVDPATAARLLDSPDRILTFAQLLEEEAAQETDENRRTILRGRAVELRGHAERV